MKTMEDIKSAIRELPIEDVRKLRAVLDDLIEDKLELTPEFEAQIRQSEKEMSIRKGQRK